MKVIAKPRQAGKTTELIKRSAETRYPIVCRDDRTKIGIQTLAHNLGRSIPKPLTYMEAAYSNNLRLTSPILIDDADEFLKYVCKFRIDTITISTDGEAIE